MKPISFAPLQGYTDAPYRKIHHLTASGIASYYSPFIRLEKGEVRNRDLRDIKPENNKDVPFIPQIIANSTAEFAQLVDLLQSMGYSEIDLNMGCSFPPQVKLGRGAGLLPHPDIVKSILDEMKKFSNIRFSIKMRLGLNENEEIFQLLPILNKASLSHITLHPRLGKQQFKGETDMAAFDNFYGLCECPIVYNGDITTLNDLQQIEDSYPNLSGIMLGRGLLARPTLAAEYAEGKEFSYKKRRDVISEMHTQLFAYYENVLQGESQLLQKMHAFWEYQESEIEKKVFKKIVKAGNLKNYKLAICGF